MWWQASATLIPAYCGMLASVTPSGFMWGPGANWGGGDGAGSCPAQSGHGRVIWQVGERGQLGHRHQVAVAQPPPLQDGQRTQPDAPSPQVVRPVNTANAEARARARPLSTR
jgi:hypothetical protein